MDLVINIGIYGEYGVNAYRVNAMLILSTVYILLVYFLYRYHYRRRIQVSGINQMSFVIILHDYSYKYLHSSIVYFHFCVPSTLNDDCNFILCGEYHYLQLRVACLYSFVREFQYNYTQVF